MTDRDTVCVVGLGYVGLPLAVAFDEAGLRVVGYDVDEAKVSALDSGTDPTDEVGDEAIATGDAEFTTDPKRIAVADYVVLTVPTPVDDDDRPNLRFVEAAGETVGEHMSAGTTVVLESTVFPGATESVLLPTLEAASGMRVGEGFEIGYSPERASPGDAGRSVRDVVKVVSGRTDDVRENLASLYGTIIDADIYEAPDIQTAEAAKAIENVQRDINIALVNELSMACENIGLDTEEVLETAGSKWNFHDGYRPGLVGGHCIPVDPYLFAHRSEQEGFSPKLILQAREINEHMAKHAADLTVRALNECGKVLKESRLLVLGLSYKPNVGDIRTSKVGSFIDELETYDIDVVAHDPHADQTLAREEFGVELVDEPTFDGFDGVVLATGHDTYDALDFCRAADRLNEQPVLVDIAGNVDESAAQSSGYVYRQL